MSPTTRLPTTNATPLHLTRDYDWRDDAVCARQDQDVELWFPVGESAQARMQAAQAKTLCRQCPVRDDCLEYALETGQPAGVWGGYTASERRGMSRNSETAFVRCLEDQEYIEKRRAQAAGYRELAKELGVSYELMRRVIRYFEAERLQQAGTVEESAVAA